MSNPNDNTGGDRDWDNAWVKWTTNGCPNNEPGIPIPGRHPQNDHQWNVDKNGYCASKNVKWTQPGEKEKAESEEEY